MCLGFPSHSYILKKLMTPIVLNGILVNLFLDVVALRNMYILTARIAEEFSGNMLPITHFWIF